MTVSTQYNPNHDLNAYLIDAGASKTVYALVTPETEMAKRKALGLGDDYHWRQEEYLDMFRGAWTKKQDTLHEDFFSRWHEWSSPVVDFDRANFPYYYPCNGASEPIRHLIFDWAAGCTPTQPIHVFEGEYEGYKAMAEAARIPCVEHKRVNWRNLPGLRFGRDRFDEHSLFFISAPSAIDGNVWQDFNEFLDIMSPNTVVVDVTYVGAVPRTALLARFNLNAPSVRSVIFSLSKPFGVYYDRIGGIWTRSEDPGLFGNKWFKNLTSIALGTTLMERNPVFALPERYGPLQREQTALVSEALGLTLAPSDVYVLATGAPTEGEMSDYLNRAGRLRVCVTPGMARKLGTEGTGG